MTRRIWVLLPWVVLHTGALWPLLLLVWDFAQGELTINPVHDVQLRTGKAALVLLVLSLACTPVNTVFGFRAVLKLRRPLGLYAFAYAALHLANFIVLDYWFRFDLMWKDVGEKRFAIAGLAAVIALLPLAVTSTMGWRRRVGKNWERLHWLAYLAAPLAVTHLVWQVKTDIPERLLYGGLVGLLLLLRVPGIRDAAKRPRLWLLGMMGPRAS